MIPRDFSENLVAAVRILYQLELLSIVFQSCPDLHVGAVRCLGAGDIQIIGLPVAQAGYDIIVAVAGILQHPAIMAGGFRCTPLLDIGASLCGAVGNLQIESAVYVDDLIDLAGVDHAARIGHLFQNPVLAGVSVALPLLDVGTAALAGILHLHAGLLIGSTGVNGIGAVLVQGEQVLLRILPAALRPERQIGAVVRLSAGGIHEVGDLVAHLTVQIIVSVAGGLDTPCVVRCCAVCTPLLEVCAVLSSTVGNFQIESAVHVLQHVDCALPQRRSCRLCRRGRCRRIHRCGGLSQYSDVGTCRQRLVRAEVEAGVWRLVIGGLLCRNLYPILRVVHQCRDAVVRVVGGAVDADGLAVRPADNEFLPPVAEDVGGQAGRALGGVAGVIAIGGEQCGQLAVCAHLGDGGRGVGVAVQNLTLQIAVPVGQKVDCRSAAAEGVAAAVKDIVPQSPEFCAVVAGPDIVRTAASRVAGAVLVEEDLAVGGIYQRNAVGLILVADPQLQPAPAGEKIPQVQRIAVSLVQAPQHLAVVVQTGRTCDDLLLAVAIHIGSHAVMVAVAVASSTLVVAGVKRPALHQLLIDYVIGGSSHTGVIASSGDYAGVYAVQICHCAPEPIHTIAVAVTPLGNRATSRLIVDGVQRCAGAAVEQGVVLRSGEHIPAGIAVVLGGIADDCTLAVHRAVRRLAGHLRLAIAVEVRHKELGVVCAGTDVLAQVNAPQACAVQPVAVNEDIAGLALLGVILGVGGIPLHKDLIGAVTVHIAHRAVIGRIGAAASCGRIQIQLKIALVGDQGALLRGNHLAAFYCIHTVGIRTLSAGIQITGGFSGVAGIDQRVVPVQLEHGTVRIVGEKPPADQHSRPCVDGGDSPVEILHLISSRSRNRLRHSGHSCTHRCQTKHCGGDPCSDFSLHTITS